MAVQSDIQAKIRTCSKHLSGGFTFDADHSPCDVTPETEQCELKRFDIYRSSFYDTEIGLSVVERLMQPSLRPPCVKNGSLLTFRRLVSKTFF